MGAAVELIHRRVLTSAVIILATGVINLGTSFVVQGVFVGTVLLPHGDFAFDPTLFDEGTTERTVAEEVAHGSRRAARWLLQPTERHGYQGQAQYQNQEVSPASRRKLGLRSRHRNRTPNRNEPPEIILLTTPHGIKLDYDYGLYLSSKGHGTATIGNDLPPSNSSSSGRYNVTLDVDLAPVDVGRDLLEWLTRRETTIRTTDSTAAQNVTKRIADKDNNSIDKDLFPVSGIYSYNDETPIPLNWGEIIPLMLLQSQDIDSSSSSSFSASSKNSIQKDVDHTRPRPLILTFPHRRYDHAVDMVPELLRMGNRIMEWIETRPERIGVVISGDLAHTHQETGPYGYSNASGLFDTAMEEWADGSNEETSRNSDPCSVMSVQAILDKAPKLQPDAKSCGFTGYILWHGMMRCPMNDSGAEPIDHYPIDVDSVYPQQEEKHQFRSEVLVNRNVTYYGMMAAIFHSINLA